MPGPKTGTTGQGFRWARALGHTLVPLRAALAPIYLEPAPPEDWSGVAMALVTTDKQILRDFPRVARALADYR